MDRTDLPDQRDRKATTIPNRKMQHHAHNRNSNARNAPLDHPARKAPMEAWDRQARMAKQDQHHHPARQANQDHQVQLVTQDDQDRLAQAVFPAVQAVTALVVVVQRDRKDQQDDQVHQAKVAHPVVAVVMANQDQQEAPDQQAVQANLATTEKTVHREVRDCQAMTPPIVRAHHDRPSSSASIKETTNATTSTNIINRIHQHASVLLTMSSYYM